jgi:DNA invertase Pin-like site-specific DNA recombinase
VTGHRLAPGNRATSITVVVIAVIVAWLIAAPGPGRATGGASTRLLAEGAGMSAAPSAQVREVQRPLDRRGCDPGRHGAGGRFNSLTSAAVRRMLAHHGLAVDGVVGDHTRKAVLSRLIALKTYGRSEKPYQAPIIVRGRAVPNQRRGAWSGAQVAETPKALTELAVLNSNWLDSIVAGALGGLAIILAMPIVELARRRRRAQGASRPRVLTPRRATVNKRGQGDPVTEAGRDEPVTEPDHDERVTELGRDEPVTEPDHDERVTELGRDKRVTEPGQNERVTKLGHDEAVTERGHHQPVPVPAVEQIGSARPTPVPGTPEQRQRRESPLPACAPVIGYVIVSDELESGDADAAAGAIEATCEQSSWELLETVRDRESGRALERPGLAYALERIAKGDARGLVVSDLHRVSGSLVELGALMAWFREADATLISLDTRIDTSTSEGRAVASTLITMSRWERERTANRSGRGPGATRTTRRSAGRPAITDRPELVERIAAMRANNMTLQAIADQLNAERVPTLRGGAKWRPSSIQVALGYRRPSAVDHLPPLGRRERP